MDIDQPLSNEGKNHKEVPDDDDEREAPSEQDTDKADSKGVNDHMKIQLEEYNFIHIQSMPLDFGVFPLQAKVLNFGSTSKPYHLASLEIYELANEQNHNNNHKGDPDDEDMDAHDEDKDTNDSSLQSLPLEEGGEVLPPLSPSKPSVSTRSKHVSSRASPKDWQSR